MKITEYPKVTSIEKDDVLLTDGGGRGTRTITSEDTYKSMADNFCSDPAISHRNIYRGKNLGNAFTDEQKAHIADGSFKDLYVGDYWVDSEGNEWLIADINYYYPENSKTGENHILVLPRKGLYTYAMHTENAEGKGSGIVFVNTDMDKNGLTKAKNLIYSLFGESNVYNVTKLMYTTMGATSKSYTWQHRTVDLLTLDMIFGYSSYQDTNGVSSVDTTDQRKQLSIFALNPRLTGIANQAYWTQSIFETYYKYAVVSDGNTQGFSSLTKTNYVRPFVAIKG